MLVVIWPARARAGRLAYPAWKLGATFSSRTGNFRRVLDTTAEGLQQARGLSVLTEYGIRHMTPAPNGRLRLFVNVGREPLAWLMFQAAESWNATRRESNDLHGNQQAL